jgi:hypothetical protein
MCCQCCLAYPANTMQQQAPYAAALLLQQLLCE